jgi:3-carboxy-cis,cis-muconate cycloisomerase
MAETLEGLVVDEMKLRQNLEALQGLPMTEMVSLALAGKIGREEAHRTVEAAARTAAAGMRPLAETLAEDPRVAAHFGRAEIDALANPDNAMGAAQTFIDLALAQSD